MKELSVEQKAQRYDEAFEKAKNYHSTETECNIRIAMENLFPELAESEDERIRKALIKLVKKAGEGYENVSEGVSIQKAISWLEKQGELVKHYENKLDKCACDNFNKGYKKALEKQGEQKVNEIYPIFRVGDYIRNKKTNNKVLIKQLDIKSKAYYYTSYDGAAEVNSDFSFYEQDKWELIGQKIIEQKPDDKVEKTFKIDDWVVCEAAPRYTAFEIGDVVQISSKETLKIFLMFKDCFRPWTIQDAKCGDILVDDLGNICIYQELSTNFMYHSFCYGNHKCFIDSGGSHKIVGTCPATKEQCNLLFQKMKEEGYIWNAEKKELKMIKGKSADNVKPKFHEGDIIWFKGFGHNIYTIKKVCGLSHYVNTNGNRMDMSYTDANFEIIKDSDKVKLSPVWSEEDESTRKALSNIIGMYYLGCTEKIGRDRLLNWLNSLEGRVQPKEEWSEDDKGTLDFLVDYLLDTIKKMPAEEYACGLGKAVVLLKYIKERVMLQPLKEWSDGDKEVINLACSILYLNFNENENFDKSQMCIGEIIDKLESLKERCTWKPSCEQLDALEHSLGDYNIKIFEDRYEILKSLYNDLKKLREG